ncbi:PREDICTED: McKusick-Kaufman/Bardet-Biedl syndromes putative chaperonin-like [Amphimedon queenslandica]|uniref:Uncharacterized protein n=1 Tax=Amphimedon queenslandica TaxID=400682 RepID=A0A1X7UWA2_AMPQE|nr:PREDICTED: McKusick-Kaufman/Bardet-Biedl syndromes putative chaperonin-like [Amphimedon queenslandica]|eukprot:XP_019852045.1 PREDICTED: McKusick-Kaufman/Bardet-Biedl syndromes putative chaperonin-like [Amphimedon queenslandica]
MLKHVAGPDTQKELKEFRDVLATCYGPHGRVALLQPVASGHVTITSQSGKVFQLLDSLNPVLRILTGSLSTYSQRHKDAAKLASLLTTNIILNCFALDCPRRQISDIIDHILTECIERVRTPPYVITCDWSSVSHLMSVTRTLLSSHSLSSCFNNEELNHFSSVLLQAFLHVAVPSNSKDDHGSLSIQNKIHVYLINEIQCPCTKLYHGLLIEEMLSIGFDREMTLSLAHHDFRRDKNGHISVAVFKISLAGDEDDGFKNKTSFEASISSQVSASRMIADAKKEELLELGATLFNSGVGLVLCQKCVHHSLREYLEGKGVPIIERLGLPYIDPVIDLTGAVVINSLSATISPQLFGHLKSVTVQVIGDKQFILLEGPSPHATIILPFLLEIVGEELKSVVKSTINILEDLLYNPQLVSGGGCVLTQLASFITKQAECVDDELCGRLMSSINTYLAVSNALSTSLKQCAAALYHNKRDSVTLTDSLFNHCWSFPHSHSSYTHFDASRTCSCGRVSFASIEGEQSAVVPLWSTVNSWKGLPTLIPETLEQSLLTDSTLCYSKISPSLFLSDSLSGTASAITFAKDLSTLIIRTHSTLF